jgi:hypothetical protein
MEVVAEKFAVEKSLQNFGVVVRQLGCSHACREEGVGERSNCPKIMKSIFLSSRLYAACLVAGLFLAPTSQAAPQARPVAADQLAEELQSRTSARLVQFCRSYLGRRLGNGECSEVAVYGLPAAGAELDFDNPWGRFVCQYTAVDGRPTVQVPSSQKSRKPDVRPGDLIQYEGVLFESYPETGYSFREYPHHTSVVERVSSDGLTLIMLEQNVMGAKYVQRTRLFLPEMTAGTMRVTRPIPLEQ